MQVYVGSKHLESDTTVALDAEGREHLVVVTKASWRIPQPGQRPKPLPPLPLARTDEYFGEPGLSAMRYGADMARYKPRCDVVFDACAHSPGPDAVEALLVEVQVGAMRKEIRVLGPRRWKRGKGGPRLSDPEPFTSLPLHFGLAFGGTRWFGKGKDTLCEAFLENPAGLGYAGRETMDQIHDALAPSLEAPGEPVRTPHGDYRPVALSAVGRHWTPRRELAGTYDETWRRDVFPLLPSDFDEQFHQFAPRDQQIDFPTGGERVVLRHMVAGRPVVAFALPPLNLQVRILKSDYTSEAPPAMMDTLFFEPEKQRFSAVWRASTALRRGLQDIDTVAVGPVDPIWWQDRVAGRPGGGCAGCGGTMAAVESEGD